MYDRKMGLKYQMKRERAVSEILAAVFITGILGIGIAAGWYWLFGRPYCVGKDCRGKGINVETIRQWEEQAKDSSFGIIRMAGWRTEAEQMVVSISTGRRQRADTVSVYGSMELADRAKLLWGRFGLAVEEDYCVLSEALARNLFGSADVVGEWVKTEEGKLMVAGVIHKEDNVLMIPATEGNVEYLSVEFDSRKGAEGQLKRLMEGY